MWIFVVFGAAFFSSWLLFATVWYLTCLVHGDFDEDNRANESYRGCVTAVRDFTSCFLFSIETQHTIGYGVR
jgi:potassium inwardly-rectifying channel subfamily J, other